MSRFIALFQRATRRKPPRALLNYDDMRLYDVTPFAAEIDLSAVEVVRWAPVWMSRAERLLLFALIFGLRPARYLEIGTFKGGSALVVAGAMDASGSNGRIVCVDPKPQIDPEHWKCLAHRTTLIIGRSPGVLPRAMAAAGGPFDFVLIDGDHSRVGVLRDANGALPFVADGAYLLFHDSLFTDVADGLRDFVAQNAHQIADTGTLTREITLQPVPEAEPIRWGGLRLMQVRRTLSAR